MTKYNISKASVFFLNQFFALNISPTSSLISQNFITWSQIRHKNLNNIDLLNSSSTYHLNNNWRQFCSESFYCYFILLILEKLFDWPFATRYFLSNDYCFSWLNHKKQENDQAFIALQNEICLWIESQKKIILDKSEDFFGNFYQSLFSKSKRRRFGEFFTPTWLADDLSIRAIQTFFITRYSKSLSIKSPVSSTSTRFLLNSNSWKQNFSNTTFIKASFPNILDPSCGSGTFLLSVIRFYKTLNLPYQTILSKITGFDLNPVSVLMARFNILFEFLTDFQTSNQRQTFLRFLLRQKKTTFPSIFLCDSIQNDWVENIISERRPSDQWSKMFDIILGNPPWMNWDHLPLLYREKTKFLWEKYHLFNLSGKEARYGGSKKELAALMLYACADLFLKNNGFLAMVLPQSLFQTAKAGQGFRQFQLPRQNHQEFYRLRLLEINDYSAINPFPEVNSKTAAVLFQKDRSITHFPVPYFIWEKNRFSRSSIQDSQYFAKKKMGSSF